MYIIFILQQSPGGHFEFPILAELHLYNMSLYLKIFLPNMKTIGHIL